MSAVRGGFVNCLFADIKYRAAQCAARSKLQIGRSEQIVISDVTVCVFRRCGSKQQRSVRGVHGVDDLFLSVAELNGRLAVLSAAQVKLKIRLSCAALPILYLQKYLVSEQVDTVLAMSNSGFVQSISGVNPVPFISPRR